LKTQVWVIKIAIFNIYVELNGISFSLIGRKENEKVE